MILERSILRSTGSTFDEEVGSAAATLEVEVEVVMAEEVLDSVVLLSVLEVD